MIPLSTTTGLHHLCYEPNFQKTKTCNISKHKIPLYKILYCFKLVKEAFIYQIHFQSMWREAKCKPFLYGGKYKWNWFCADKEPHATTCKRASCDVWSLYDKTLKKSTPICEDGTFICSRWQRCVFKICFCVKYSLGFFHKRIITTGNYMYVLYAVIKRVISFAFAFAFAS